MRPVRKLWAECQAEFGTPPTRDIGGAVVSMFVIVANLIFWGVILGAAL